MTNPISYHEKIKNERHVFLYCVVGRSSSTAFQRLINSSNKVWLWGEPRGIINQAILLINQMKKVNSDDNVKLSLSRMYHSYNDNKHLEFYANAIGNLDSSIEMVSSAISNILKPWAPGVKRFGFKDIDPVSSQTLGYLKEIYPQSIFMFCFRDPLTQWSSICKLDWPMSKTRDVKAFLDRYHLMASMFLQYAEKNDINAFVENNDLRNEARVNLIMKYLNIPKIDSSLINVTVGSLAGDKLTPIEKETILKSEAYKDYKEMRKISSAFYEDQKKDLVQPLA
ncbi:MAG: sulfotransferase family protein [Mucilaginibacter sp.]|nr:sulfotransferase family protein [Mucilaginibacter sp.]